MLLINVIIPEISINGFIKRCNYVLYLRNPVNYNFSKYINYKTILSEDLVASYDVSYFERFYAFMVALGHSFTNYHISHSILYIFYITQLKLKLLIPSSILY